MISVSKLCDIMRDTEIFLSTIVGYLAFANERHIDLTDPYSCIMQDDEEICLVWTKGAVKCDVGFQGDRTYSYWAKNLTTQEEWEGDNIPVDHVFPLELLELLVDNVVRGDNHDSD